MRSGWSALAWLLLGSSLALGPRADDAGFGHGGSSGSGHPGAAQRTSSTIKIGKYDRSSGLGGLGGLGGTGQRGSSMIKIGEGSKLLNISRVVRPLLTTSMTSTTIPLSYASVSPESQGSAEFSNGTKMLKVGLAVPYKSFGYREYTKAVSRVVTALQKSTKRPNLGLFQHYDIFVKVAMQELTPSPMNILNSLCKEFLSLNVSAILYLMNYEQYGRSTASTQYFLQLAGYLGIPVIAWNADNSGLERSSLHLQLAPSIEHQAAAMLSILERYKWHQFSVVTSQIAGHDDFVQAVRERISDMQERFKFTMLNAVTVTKSQDLKDLVSVESRVMLLYSSKEEANNIFRHAAEFKITGENYVWVVTQSVIQNIQPGHHFPVGMIGVHFDTSSTSIVNEIATAIKVYAYGVEDFVNDPRNYGYSLNTQLSCEDLSSESRWSTGEYFFKYLKNVSVEAEYGKPSVEFTQDGVLKSAELKIMNLRPGPSMQLVWEEQRRQQHRQHQRQHQRHRYRHEREPLQQPAKPPRQQHRFSLCRVYWLVWAVLFQAAVHVDSPRGFTARFMTNVWAMFAVVFLAIYTANLAAFMITREEFFDFSGVDDQRLARPTSHKPPIKFGTVPFTHTDSVLAKYFKEMYAYMRTHSKGSVSEGVEAVVNGDLDAFIYDGTVIDYLVSQDQDCRLLTVGSWYAMTGYGLAFPRNSRFLKMFNQKLLEYRDNGDLERLRRFWMTGTCRPDKEVQKSSDPLALEQFLSAFLMLMVGTLIAAFLLLLEHLYSTYVRRRLAKDARAGRCCGLLSSVSTRSSPAPPSLHARLSCACSASRPAPPRRGDSSEPSRRRLFLEAAARRLGHAGTPRREGRLGRAQPWLSRMCTAAFLRCSTCYK
ncbi:glutamate receptor ionotropic, NMDA 2A-like isoform X5 [Phymastichus coffea]|uniref:glutamate receptor ionotropic, NMDA 2A-like isoform X5 n=1 Tax=Phymastichus coffea TaxID=108790 RepID=UPI00273AAC43|nr:glutamate receptor ionotropic, NMDA 2A-like isoform X5 [Phymastichus coffea]